MPVQAGESPSSTWCLIVVVVSSVKDAIRFWSGPRVKLTVPDPGLTISARQWRVGIGR